MCGPIRCAIWRFKKARELIMCRCHSGLRGCVFTIRQSGGYAAFVHHVIGVVLLGVLFDRPGAVTDFESRTDVLDGPRRREAARLAADVFTIQTNG